MIIILQFQQEPSEFPLCIIITLDDRWPTLREKPEKDENVRPFSKQVKKRTSLEKTYGLGNYGDSSLKYYDFEKNFISLDTVYVSMNIIVSC